MSYYISKTIKSNFDEAIQHVTETMKTEGFGVVSTINLQGKLKEKIDVDIQKYVILGVCNPGFAYKSLQLENKVGAMLPCNVIVQELEDGKIEIAAVDPVESMKGIPNQKLGAVLGEVRVLLQRAIDKL